MFLDIGLHPTLDDQSTVFHRSSVDIQAAGADAKPMEFISKPERFSRLGVRFKGLSMADGFCRERSTHGREDRC
ncbi:MAG: hypothetical protein BRD31_01495 [Bacteroidetes bacterium QH_2_64_26]|nr:MAG: hypothetical protein BRD31_01495 [Bacteroidetes bacterium QH_2_64_26]